MNKIRVLIVDDSPLFRDFLYNGLSRDERISVCGMAGDPYEARDLLTKLKPDVMTCDIEMPKMDGIEFVKKLIPQYPIPVVMISSLSDRVFEALNAGAVDFVAKPSGKTRQEMQSFVSEELVPRVVAASISKIRRLNESADTEVKSVYSTKKDISQTRKNIVIAIGASTGGTEAIYEVVKAFGKDIPGIVVTQHIPPGFSAMFAERLNRQCTVSCKEAVTGDIVKPGQILVAPGDKQMRLVKVGDVYQVECRTEEKVNGHCPSVEVLFESVAKVAGKNAIGVLLTGMGSDGAKGLLSMRNAGAETIGQDKNTSVVYGMPMEAYKMGAVKFQLPLNEIPKKVMALVQRF